MFAPKKVWQAPQAFPSFRGLKRIAVDVETCDPTLAALGPGVRRGGYICGLAVGDDERSFYFPTRHLDGGNLDPGLVWRWARAELNAFTGDVVGANILYDLDYLAEMGVAFPNAKRFLDVQVAEPLLDEHRLEYNLDSLAEKYLGERKQENLLRDAALSYGWKTNAEIKGNLHRLHASYVGPYGESDANLPLRVLDQQLVELEKQDLLGLFEVESGLIPILLAMRRRGVRVDVERAGEVRERLIAERSAALADLRRIAGPKAELMAPDSFINALRAAGLNPPLTGKTGKPSIKAAWLKANRGIPVVDAIARGRRVDYTINTFIEGHIFTHSINGRIHCEFNQLKRDEGGTIARFSSSNPNLQNVPGRDEELAPLVRGLFVPDEGDEWERHDQSQMEYRLQVHYAVGPGAEEAREKYRTDPKTDFHNLCMEFLGQDPSDKNLRKRVKGINFAKSYGAMAPKIAISLGVSLQEAQEFIEKYETALPFTKKTFEKAQKLAGARGYIRSLLGRYSRFELWEPESNARTKMEFRATPYQREIAEQKYGAGRIVRANTYKALNNLLQFGNADYVKKTMVDIWNAGLCNVLGAPLLTVHDELDWSVPKTKEGDEAVREAKRIMETAIPLRVPVLVEAQRGLNWGACG